MLGFIKKCFFTVMTFFSFIVLNVNSLECISMNNQECKIRSEIINVNTSEPIFYPYSITVNAKVVTILLMTQMLNYVFLILLKT